MSRILTFEPLWISKDLFAVAFVFLEADEKSIYLQYCVCLNCLVVKQLCDDDDDDDVAQLPADDEVLLQKLREESRAVFLQRKSRELLDNEELQVEDAQHSSLSVLLDVLLLLLCVFAESVVSA